MNALKQFENYSDAELIGKIIDGETKLYELLIRRYNPSLYKVGRMYNYNHQDTEDLMQDTYVNAFCNLSGFRGNASFKTWIIRIMLNNCFQKKQKFSFQKEKPTEDLNIEKNRLMFQKQTNTEKEFLNKELGHIIENLLSSLPEEARLVFAMRELNGLSTAETAEALNISESNVKVRLNRSKALLRSELQKFYSPEEIFEFNLVYCDRIVEKVMTKINTLTQIV